MDCLGTVRPIDPCNGAPDYPTVRLACSAMATRFELVMYGADLVRLRAAGEEALAEIERLEDQLSLYRPGTEIAQVNARAAEEPVRVSPAVFRLLEHAQQLHQQTGGAFDITIAPLVQCWGFMAGQGRRPSLEELESARSRVGMHRVRLDPSAQTVGFEIPGMMIDLGAIGKGYAIEQAAEILREAGVTSALLHGGTSTAYGLGHPPEADHWKVAVGDFPEGIARTPEPLPAIALRDQAISVSAIWGRSFQAEGKVFGHVLDPRTGEPVRDNLLAAVVLLSPTETDALSTALLVRGRAGHDEILGLRSGMRTLLVTQSQGQVEVQLRGLV